MVWSQFNLSSKTILLFQFGYGDNSTELGRVPGTTSASDAGFPGLIRGTVTNIRCLGTESEVEPELKYNFSSDVPKISENVKNGILYIHWYRRPVFPLKSEIKFLLYYIIRIRILHLFTFVIGYFLLGLMNPFCIKNWSNSKIVTDGCK